MRERFLFASSEPNFRFNTRFRILSLALLLPACGDNSTKTTETESSTKPGTTVISTDGHSATSVTPTTSGGTMNETTTTGMSTTEMTTGTETDTDTCEGPIGNNGECCEIIDANGDCKEMVSRTS